MIYHRESKSTEMCCNPKAVLPRAELFMRESIQSAAGTGNCKEREPLHCRRECCHEKI